MVGSTRQAGSATTAMTTRRAAYRQIADEITAAIQSGALAPGTRLPTVAQLAEQHKVSLSTIDRAMGILHERGVIVGHPGKGVFVAGPDAS